MAPLRISKSKSTTYENFYIFGFSIVENLGYMPVLNSFGILLHIVDLNGRLLQRVSFKRLASFLVGKAFGNAHLIFKIET